MATNREGGVHVNREGGCACERGGGAHANGEGGRACERGGGGVLLRHGRDVRPTWVGRCVPCVTLVSTRGFGVRDLGPKRD